MSRSHLSEVLSLQDPLQSWQFDIFFPRIPGAGDTRPATYKAQSTTLPGGTLDKVEVALHGVKLQFAGQANYSHSWEVTFIETRDTGTRSMFMNWRENARSWIQNTGTYKSEYGVACDVVLYDDLPSVVRTVRLFGCWPETVGDYSLDGSASNLVTMPVTFSFDQIQEIIGED